MAGRLSGDVLLALVEGSSTVRAVVASRTNCFLAVWAVGIQLAGAFGTIIKPNFHWRAALGAQRKQRLTQNEVQDDAKAVRYQDGNCSPQPLAHASTSRIAIDVSEQQN